MIRTHSPSILVFFVKHCTVSCVYIINFRSQLHMDGGCHTSDESLTIFINFQFFFFFFFFDIFFSHVFFHVFVVSDVCFHHRKCIFAHCSFTVPMHAGDVALLASIGLTVTHGLIVEVFSHHFDSVFFLWFSNELVQISLKFADIFHKVVSGSV